MPSLISITFRHSRAKDFPDILRRRKNFDRFFKGEVYTLEINEPNELLSKWNDFMAIATRIPQLAGSSASFMGEPVIPFKPDFFYKIQDSLYYCYHKGYKQTIFRDRYCTGDWGCRQLTGVVKEHVVNRWELERHWYRLGKFEGGVWKVDKTAIYRALMNEVGLKLLDICPAFNEERVMDLINNLPDEIIIDHNWTVLKRKELTKDGFREIPFSIVPKEIKVEDSPIDLKEEEPLPELDVENMTEDEINDFLDEWLEERE